MPLTLVPNLAPRTPKTGSALGWMRLIDAVRSVTEHSEHANITKLADDVDWDGEFALQHGNLVLRHKRGQADCLGVPT